MDCDRARRTVSERMDGERLSSRVVEALEHHLATCGECTAFQAAAWKLREAARFEVAPAVPDLVDPIMASVAHESRRSGRARLRLIQGSRGPRRRLGRSRSALAPMAAALVVGLVAGSVAVGGPWQPPEQARVDAAEVASHVAAAATRLSNYEARFAMTEFHLSPDVPIREFSMNVWFRSPERFRLDVVDHTNYPTKATTPTDLELIVNASSWYSVGPSACPANLCPPMETVVRNRVPFSPTTPAPTDLILPVTTLADANQLEVMGRGTVLGRPAIEVALPFERAEPLFPFLSLGGTWRPFFERDTVDLWLDSRSWFPLRFSVYPAAGRERARWALRFGLPDEPPTKPIFEVQALSVDEGQPAAGTFRIPAAGSPHDHGAKPITIAEAPSAAHFAPVVPRQVDGLALYQVVLPPPTPTDTAHQTLITFSKGLAWLKLGEARGWGAKTLYGPVGLRAREVTLPNVGVAYFEPATADNGRRLAIHTAGADLYLESNLPRSKLFKVAASLPVTGVRIPNAWAVRRSSDGVTERLSVDQAAQELPFPLQMPESDALPSGYELASAELVRLRHSTALNVYFQQHDSQFGSGPLRLHEETASALPPASSAQQLEVDVRDAQGRWTPDRNQLEWIEGGVYYSLDGAGLQLTDLLAVAASLTPLPEASPSPAGDPGTPGNGAPHAPKEAGS